MAVKRKAAPKGGKWVDVIIGHGQTGTALGDILRPSSEAMVFIDPFVKGESLAEARKKGKLRFDPSHIVIMHICIRASDRKALKEAIAMYVKEVLPDMLIIHSTVAPGTTDEVTAEIDKLRECPHFPACDYGVVFSPIRGQHNDLSNSMKSKYTKYFASDSKKGAEMAAKRFRDAKMRTRVVANVATLEWAKHMANTLYYHHLLAYRQMVHHWCDELGLDEEDLWSFTKELYEHTGVQVPLTFDPKGIGGHCVLQNTELLLSMPRSKLPKNMAEELLLLKKMNDITVGRSKCKK